MTGKTIALLLAGLLASCAESATPPRDGTGDVPVVELPDGADAPADDAPGEAGCPAGQTDCGGLCVDTSSDHDHCGGCASPCEPAEVCMSGVCLFECPSGTVACGGSCTDVMTDIQNCGACDTACTAGLHAEPVCELGLCGVRCEAGWTDPDGDGSCDEGCAPTSPTETCNGVDDNCDGQVDEGFPCRMGREVGCTTVCASTGSGICGLDCRVPAPGACTPPAEVCNGQDDDCTGGCDNGFACCRGEEETCTSSCGSQGARLCSALCEWSACIPPAETCNGADDDCDGTCDDGFGCCRGEAGSCTTSCGSTGTRSCNASCVWDTCAPPAETCNGADDDCDGTCDDGSACCRGASGSCTTSCGSAGSRTCSSSCAWGSCTPPGETCNGTDDDCDGTCDDGFGCCRGATGSCTTSCGSTGTHTCSSSCSWGTCAPPAETMNFADDDCDGVVDEGYSVIAHGHDDCTGAGGTCPAGYTSRGSFKIDTVACGGGHSGEDYAGYIMRSGWFTLCSPTDDVLLVKGHDDCTGASGGCPGGYSSRASFKVDTVACGGGASGTAYDGQTLNSGWMHLCSRTTRERIVLGSDDCTGAGGGCPGGTSSQGTWKPDVTACNPSQPSAVTTDGYSLNSGWVRYCVSN